MMVDSQNPYAAPQAADAKSSPAQWMSGVSPPLTRTRLGLGLVYLSIVIILLASVVIVAGLFGKFDAKTVDLMISSLGISVLVASFLIFIGELFCLETPTDARTRPFVICSLILQFPIVVSGVAHQFGAESITRQLRSTAELSMLAGLILFVVFLKRLGRYVGRDDCCRRATVLLWAFGILVVTGAIWFGLMLTGIARSVPYIGIAIGLGGLLILVSLANLIYKLRKAIA